jgi:hypothetical protein
MKSIVLVIISSVWILGTLTPPIVSLFLDDSNFICLNLNEEEPQEEEKKDLGEEKILAEFNRNTSLNGYFQNSNVFIDLSKDVVNQSTEILLPPPEYNS